ncbi:MAG: glycosyltransferase family 39 protein [Thermodesulfobacteriota bacterium]
MSESVPMTDEAPCPSTDHGDASSSPSITRSEGRADCRTLSRLGPIMVLVPALVLRVWHLTQNGWGNEYYTAGVKSMTSSLHNFLYCSFDPAGFVSVDKPPVALWMQAISAKLFGFHSLSILMPQVVEGLASVLIVYHLVQRRFGALAGLLAGLFLAITPVSVAIDRSSNTDSCLVLVLLLAAWAFITAAERGSRGLLLLSMALIGLAFNVKMLAAYVVLPTFALVYVLGAPLTLRRRLGDLAISSVVLVAVSMIWVLMYDLTPPEHRPFAGTTKRNSMLELAVGPYAVGRFVPPAKASGISRSDPGPVPGVDAGSRPVTEPLVEDRGKSHPPLSPPIKGGETRGLGYHDREGEAQRLALPGNGGVAEISSPAGRGKGEGDLGYAAYPADVKEHDHAGTPVETEALSRFKRFFVRAPAGSLRMADGQLAGQVGWLIPVAVIGLGVAAFGARFRRPLAPVHLSLLLWFGWAVTYGVVYSAAGGIMHLYYLSTMAPPLAALAGIGVASLWDGYLRRGSGAVLLPAALILTALWQLHIEASALDLTLDMILNPQAGPIPSMGGGTLSGLAWIHLAVLAGAILATTCLLAVRFGRSAMPFLRGQRRPAVSTRSSSGVCGCSSPAESDLNVGGTDPPGHRNTYESRKADDMSGSGSQPLREAWGRWDRFSAYWNLGLGLTALIVLPLAWALSSVLSVGHGVLPSADLTRLFQAEDKITAFRHSLVDRIGSSKLVRFLHANRKGERFLLATQSTRLAAPIIIGTGEPVMGMGGFHGLDPILSPEKLARMVEERQVRFVMLGALSPVSRRLGAEAAGRPIAEWVRSNGRLVDPTLWSSLGSRTGSPLLYDLRPGDALIQTRSE